MAEGEGGAALLFPSPTSPGKLFAPIDALSSIRCPNYAQTSTSSLCCETRRAWPQKSFQCAKHVLRVGVCTKHQVLSYNVVRSYRKAPGGWQETCGSSDIGSFDVPGGRTDMSRCRSKLYPRRSSTSMYVDPRTQDLPRDIERAQRRSLVVGRLHGWSGRTSRRRGSPPSGEQS